MIVFSVLPIIGALWRRMYGGWLALSKTMLLVVAVTLFSLPAWLAWHSGATWVSVYGFAIPVYAKALIAMVAIGLDFALGVQFTNHWLCAVRYDLGPFILGFLAPGWAHWLPLMLVGPAISGLYWLAKDNNWSLSLPWDTADEQMIDGWSACGELAAGFFTVMAFAAFPLYAALDFCPSLVLCL